LELFKKAGFSTKTEHYQSKNFKSSVKKPSWIVFKVKKNAEKLQTLKTSFDVP
jgi:hypothetical protein